MKFIPTDSLEKLEFDKIRQLVASESFGEPAAKIINNLHPSSDFSLIMTMLKQVDECKDGILNNDGVPKGIYNDITELLQPLGIENYVLELEEMLQIRNLT
ncbi:MAG: hypothetical protein JNK41_03425, partial [Saprospiraceae bacterium]|nr:hypothetical protein [Saprospiraceae bacterium]